MAVDRTISVGLALENINTFLSEGEQANSLLGDLNRAFEQVAGAINRLDFSKFQFPEGRKVESSATAIDKFADALDKLNRSTPTSANNNGTSFLRNIENSSSKKILDTARSVTAFFNAANRLKDVNFSKFNGEINNFLDQFKRTKPEDFDKFGKGVSQLVTALNRLTKLQGIPTTVISNLVLLTTGLKELEALNLQNLSSALPSFANGLQQLGKALRSFSSGQNVGELPNVLKAAVQALEGFINVLTQLQSGLTGTIATDLKNITDAIKTFAKSAKQFADVGDFSALQDNLRNAAQAFKDFVNGFSKSAQSIDFTNDVVPSIKVLTELANVFTSLSRRSKGLVDFTTTIQSINTAVRNLDTDALV
ncbi:hypothetical protein KC678_02785, partial [Candidatus Dojkabacteria bacterium]|nr:hypothetical protein [Candidatus Dojkabacteria bacterium]